MAESVVKVAVGILRNSRAQVLISRRQAGTHLAGLWEFPGGKLEADESYPDGLRRELREELGIEIDASHPLINIRHEYPQKRVELGVYEIHGYQGDPRGMEGQETRWVDIDRLPDIPMPAADVPIVHALSLPDYYLITPPRISDIDAYLARMSTIAARGVSCMVQVRLIEQELAEVRALSNAIASACRQHGWPCVLNGAPSVAAEWGLDGVHLNGHRLREFKDRGPLRWVGASCHDSEELALAAHAGVDFAALSPVNFTPSHPDSAALGWERFSMLVERVAFPVYALGGMRTSDLDRARAAGAQGIAGIRAFD